MQLARPVPWPNGAKVACAITLDMDADSLVHIHHGSNAQNKLSATSMLRYGPEVAVPRILETFRNFDLKQSFFIPAWCIENHAKTVEAIVEDGHEIGYHGYIHEAPNSLSEALEYDWMCRSIEIIEKHTGKRPRGNRSPLYHMSAKTPDFLAKEGFLYDTSLMGDDVPYILETGQGDLLELPVSWATDDWPPYVHAPDLNYMFAPQAPDRAMEIFMAEFEALRHSPGGLWISVWHPFVSGRLSRWQRVEKMMEYMVGTGDVWFATLEEIALHIQGLEADERYTPRRDRLPYSKGVQVPEELLGKS
ncbi:polysaccharide deacetylase [uncultured Ruegeria sp.]|uniref:polysaccharide deacetylase family protein n=1 Tax=uncultured Ruegeria sp. TaxID=259304 RepID=UPI00261C9565|nr:polysaccharide deacetylase [uncultured Ruegeria sp.]